MGGGGGADIALRVEAMGGRRGANVSFSPNVIL